MYKPVVIQNRVVDVRKHECASAMSTSLCCIDANGKIHSKSI